MSHEQAAPRLSQTTDEASQPELFTGLPRKKRPASGTPSEEGASRTRRRVSLPVTSSSAGKNTDRENSRVETSPIDKARDEIKNDLDFATLGAALHAGVPARVQAVISLIADGTVSSEHFFHEDAKTGERHSVIDDLLELYRSWHRPDLSRFPEEQTPLSRAEQLASDIDCFKGLLSASQNERAHPEIQDAAKSDDYMVDAARLFIDRAASLPAQDHADAFKLLGPMLDEVLEKPAHETKPRIDDLMATLDRVYTVRLHPDARQFCHSYSLKFAAQQPPSQEAIEQAESLVQSAALLPVEHQQTAYKTAVELITKMPQAAFDHMAQIDGLSHPLRACAHSLWGLDDKVFGKAAVDLIDASQNQLPGHQFVVLKSIHEIYSHRGGETEMRFARLPGADRINLFLSMLDASRLSGGNDMVGDSVQPMHWGRSMLPHLPESVQSLAETMLRRAEAGHTPTVSFKFAAMSWPR